MKIWIAKVKDPEGNKGRVYFTSEKLNTALAHMETYFEDQSIITLNEADGLAEINEYHTIIGKIHIKLTDRFKKRNSIAIMMQELFSIKGKTHEQLDDLVLYTDELRELDIDLKNIREMVNRKQDVISDIRHMMRICS